MRRYFSAWALLGAIVFAVDVAGADAPVSLSSAPLMGATTSAMLAVDEPFINPFWTKKPKIVSPFGKRTYPNQPAPEPHYGVDYAAPVGTAGPGGADRAKCIFAGFSKMYASRTDSF